MSRRYQAAILTASYNGLQVPNAPTIGTATAGSGTASVTFTAPANVGGGAITSYTVISSPGSVLGTGASSPITVSGLTNDTAYTFTVVATNAYGSGPASAASNSVTPVANYIEAVFSTWLYTGNGTGQSIVNGINLSTNGGMVWCKARSNVESNFVSDTVRGANKALITNSTAVEDTNPRITAFNSNGFSLNSSGNSPNVNEYTYASWTFREQAKFFDIVTWTGNGTGDRAISHALGSAPGCIIVKSTLNVTDWFVYHRGTSNPNFNYTRLNLTNATNVSGDNVWDVTSTTFQAAGLLDLNNGGQTYIAYLFAHNAGGFGASGTDNVVSCGSYTTDGSGNATVTLGYEPQWLLVKASSASGGWIMSDIMRAFPASAGSSNRLFANTSAAETTGSTVPGQPTATGFIAVGDPSTTYIYIAVRRGPMKTPTVGTSVFYPFAGSDASITTGFPVDMAFDNSRTGFVSYNTLNFSRLMGVNILRTSSTVGESPDLGNWWDSNTKYYPAALGSNTVSYAYQRAPGFMDVVCYTGTSAVRTINHNLGVVPELMIVKCRSAVGFWVVYSQATGNTNYLYLDGTGSTDSFLGYWNNTTPTASVFTLGTGNGNDTNETGQTYVAYLFATCPGVSKVGSYTGTGALQTINCGFTTGARFVLIKRTDSTGSWYVWDSARGITASNDPYSVLNTATAEVTGTNYVDTTGVGFQVTAAAPAEINASGGTYIFLAIA